MIARHGEMIAGHLEMIAGRGKTIARRGKMMECHEEMIARHGEMIARHGEMIARRLEMIASHLEMIVRHGEMIAAKPTVMGGQQVCNQTFRPDDDGMCGGAIHTCIFCFLRGKFHFGAKLILGPTPLFSAPLSAVSDRA